MKKILSISLVLAIGAVSFIVSKQVMGNPSKLSKADYANGTKRAADAAKRVTPRLRAEMKGKGISVGNPVYIRIFKESRELELWVKQDKSAKYTLFKTYKVAAASGTLGPKLKEGDMQAPEGFYFVRRRQLNPQSSFHLSFNLGYPNKYDRAHGRTGSALMVHGNRVSAGCFAMTDYYIEEIYTLCDSALKKGQPYFRAHCFPFRMTKERMERAKKDKWYRFWQNLKTGYDKFEVSKIPPNVEVSGKLYKF